MEYNTQICQIIIYQPYEGFGCLFVMHQVAIHRHCWTLTSLLRCKLWMRNGE
jgi:hypothetical protein